MKKEFICPTDFNVYELEYTPEFIDKLPVDFYKIKNMDLSDVPEVYKVLFITDWNWGSYSKMDWEDRVFLNDLFVEYKGFLIMEKRLSDIGYETKGQTFPQIKKLYNQVFKL